MYKLIEKEPEKAFRHLKDVERIITVLKQHEITVSLAEAERIWNHYSDDYSAGWLGLPEKDDKLFDELEEYIDRYYVKYWC